MPKYKVSVELNTYIDTDSPAMAERLAQDALSFLLNNNERAIIGYESMHPEDTYPGLLVAEITAVDMAEVETPKDSDPVSQEELDKPAEVV
jgi:hypothetical protein